MNKTATEGGTAMHLQESGEMYLETIYTLTRERSSVRSIDVCEHMGFSKPSVSRAIGLLKSGGFVQVDAKGYLTLTAQGEEVAKRTFDRHRLLKEVFVRLGVDEAVADADACKIEHHISDQTMEALKRHLDQLNEK
jgi:Mn-dependent DtxR family transcriptional regulator